jgi:hypothetical protein
MEGRAMSFRLVLNLFSIFVLVTISAVVAGGSGFGIAPAGATGPGGVEVLTIPLRWCAMHGASTADNPGVFGEPDTDHVLWRRHERATDQIWLPGADINYRSAIGRMILDEDSFPLIDDPQSSPGMPGDILDPNLGSTEFNQARALCEARWSSLAAKWGVPNVGVTAVSIRRFVDSSGNPTDLWGRGVWENTFPSGADTCDDPTLVITNNGAIVIVDHDPAVTPGLSAGPTDAKLVGHELGHVLELAHGNGRDDDGDGVFDEDCDPGETSNTPATVMHPTITSATTVVTSLQRNRARAIARKTSGIQIDPPAALVNGQTISDQRSDPYEDVEIASVDMTAVRIAVNASQDTVALSHVLFGLLRDDEENQYLLFLDLDTNPTTGGKPSELGFTTDFEGAEVVTRVAVAGLSATPTVWRYDGTSFVEIVDPNIEAQIVSAMEAESDMAVNDIVSVLIPIGLTEPIRPAVRFQAISEQLAPSPSLDVLPGGLGDPPGNASETAYPVAPVFPVCYADPPQVDPGDMATIHASNFGRWNEQVHVILGDEPVADAVLDDTGNVSVSFVVPTTAAMGPRLVTIGVEESALTADCVLQVGRQG